MISSLLNTNRGKQRPRSGYGAGAGGGNALSAISALENENGDDEIDIKTTTDTAKQPRIHRTAIEIVEDNILRKQRIHDRFFSVVSDVQSLRKMPIGLEAGIVPATERIIQQEQDQLNFDTSHGAISMTTNDHFLSQTLRSLLLFKPNGQRMMLWDLFVILAIIYSVFEVPLQIGFKSNILQTSGEIGMNYFITTVFFADLLVTFNIPFYSRKLDSLIIDRKKIATRYMKAWFWIDLVAALPFDDMLASLSSNGNQSQAQLRSIKLIRIIRLTRLGKLYKLTKMGAVKDWLDNKNISPAFMNVLMLVLQLTIISHLTACFWFFITTSDATGVIQPKVPIIDDQFIYPLRTWATEFGNAIGDTLTVIPYQYADISSQYIASLYFVFTTLFTVGYGDIHAVNTGERFFTIVVELFAAITFATLIARVKAVVDSQNLLAKSLRAKMEDFKAYLEEKNVNLKLKITAKQAYAYYLKKVPDLAEEGFYEELPKGIKNHFVQHKFMREIRQIHYFRNCDICMVADLIVHSEPQQALVGDIIYDMGDYASEIAYLMKGSVRLLDLHGTTNVIMGFASSGGYFGDFEYFRKSTRITKYQAAQNCTLFTISYKHFDHTLSEYDDQKAKFLRKLGRRYDIWTEVKKTPLLYGTMTDYIATSSTTVGENEDQKLDKLMCHSSIWTDGEIEQVFADQVIESAWHTSPPKLHLNQHSITAAAPTIVGNSIAFSAEKARILMSIKVKLVESLYYNMVIYHGGQKKEVIAELPLEHMTTNWLLFPSGPLKVLWDSFIGLLIFYSVLVIPMQLAFPSFTTESTQPIVPVTYALDFMFLFDMIAAFNTPYYVEDDDAYVCIRTKIAYRYITSWFLVDLLSTVPFDLLLQAADPNSGGNQAIIVQLAKVLRLLRLAKLAKTINFAHLTNIAEDQLAVPAVAFNLLDMFFRVVFISHLVGCLWWGLTYGEMDGPHWFNNLLNTPEQLEWAAFQDQYVVSLYWTIQTLTTTGYGDFVPTNDNERILCLVILVLGATVFSYVVAHISELVQSFNHSEARVANRMTEIKEFLTDARVGSSLFKEVVEHFRQSTKRNSGFDETTILHRLPVRLQDSLMLYHYHELLQSVPIFRHIKNTSIKLFLLKEMRQCSADTGRSLVREDHLATEIVFLYKGSASMNKLIMTEQERRLNDKMKYSHLGAALLWCLRAHKTMKMQEEMETDQLEQQMRLENQARQSKELEKIAMKSDGGALLSPLTGGEERGARGTNELMIELMNVPQPPMPEVSTPSSSSDAYPQPRQQRKTSLTPLVVPQASRKPSTSTDSGLVKSLFNRGSDDESAEVSIDMKEEQLLDKLTATIRGGRQAGTTTNQNEEHEVDDGGGKIKRERNRINSLMAPISETSEAAGVNAMLSSSSPAAAAAAAARNSFLSVISVTSSEMHSGTSSPRSSFTIPERGSLGSYTSDPTPTQRTKDQLHRKGSAALKVNPYRVSARAKIRWEKVKMYLGIIVQMGLESKTKSYDVLGTLFPGDMFGYSECSERVTFKCSLVAMEPCSYCTLSVDSILAIAKEFPGIGMEIQGALGSCIAETESKIHHDQWKKRNILFLQNVRQTLVAAGEEVQRHENEYIRKNLVSSAVGSMLKPINLRFSQKSRLTVSQRSIHIDANPLNMSSKSDMSSVCDDDRPLLSGVSTPTRLSVGHGMHSVRDASRENNSDVLCPLSARDGEDNVPHSAQANLFFNKKNRVEILTQKLKKMEDFFRKSSAIAHTRQELKLQRGTSSNSIAEMVESLNRSSHNSPIRNMISVSTKKIKITTKSKSPSNVRKKHRSYADAVSISRAKHTLTERSTKVFELEDPNEKIVKKKKERRNSDGIDAHFY